VQPDGGVLFAALDGTIVASKEGSASATIDVRVVDLDGDGNDEIVLRESWVQMLGPFGEDTLTVLRMSHGEISQLWRSSISQDFFGEHVCTANVDLRARGKSKQLVIDVKRGKAANNPDARGCPLSFGRHVLALSGDTVTEASK
jgi:hypothetical protein